MKPVNPESTKRVLLVSPEYFDILYAINPFMQEPDGSLKKVNKSRATDQWNKLKNALERHGQIVEVIPGEPNFPDMVFSANQSLPFFHAETKKNSVVIGRMASEKRRDEVLFFKDYYKKNSVDVYELETPDAHFEAMGDMLPQPGSALFWGGVGSRTGTKTYAELRARFHFDIEELHPKAPFYHLDTCLCMLNKTTAAYVDEAFATKDRDKLRAHLPDSFTIDLNEAEKLFAGNAFCPDQQNVFVQVGTRKFKTDLKERGFNVIELDTSEFIKSGGSVFCLKLALPW